MFIVHVAAATTTTTTTTLMCSGAMTTTMTVTTVPTSMGLTATQYQNDVIMQPPLIPMNKIRDFAGFATVTQ